MLISFSEKLLDGQYKISTWKQLGLKESCSPSKNLYSDPIYFLRDNNNIIIFLMMIQKVKLKLLIKMIPYIWGLAQSNPVNILLISSGMPFVYQTLYLFGSMIVI